MSATAVPVSLPISAVSSANTLPSPQNIAGGLTKFIHARWVYHRTLAELEFYSERNLQDIGANQGIKEFARRAAGL